MGRWARCLAFGLVLVFSALPTYASGDLLYLSGRSGVLQMNIDGSNWQPLAFVIPHRTYDDVAAHAENGNVYWIRRNAVAGLYRHCCGVADTVIAGGFEWGAESDC